VRGGAEGMRSLGLSVAGSDLPGDLPGWFRPAWCLVYGRLVT
jgi:hypothetical protein